MVLSPNLLVALFITLDNRTSSMILMIFNENEWTRQGLTGID